MSSYLEKSQAAFASNVASAASKVSKPRTLAAPASPAPSHASSQGDGKDKDLKRKRETPASGQIYSQPSDTGYGQDAFTQVTYIIEFLKKKGDAKTFQEVLEYLSQVHISEQAKKTLSGILRKHARIQWNPNLNLNAQTWDSGTYQHRPIIAVRSKTDLIAYLQRRGDAQGVSVKELKDGWPDCEEALSELEAKHRILVTRTKKDNHARMVWSNDPTLYHPVDLEFTKMWYGIKLPDPDDLVRKLIEAGQKPASEDPSKRIKAPAKPKEKKKRPPRKGGRTTNTHMEHLLRDYDHLKR
jgi:transcription initiation factor TFIIE subunit beta